MKQKFVMTGKGEALTVKVTVEIEGDKFEPQSNGGSGFTRGLGPT